MRGPGTAPARARITEPQSRCARAGPRPRALGHRTLRSKHVSSANVTALPSSLTQPGRPERREGCSASSARAETAAPRLTLARTPGMFPGSPYPGASVHAPHHRTTPMSAQQFVVQGGNRLAGRIRPSGNKNAALPIVAASLLCEEPVYLENVPRIRDVETLVELLKSVGASAEWTGRNELTIHAKSLRVAELDPALCKKIRASILLAGPLLARCGEIELPPPGGDVIGRRRVGTHFLALERLGASFELDESFHLSTPGLRGADVFLDEPSVTGTENALMAAVAASGTTILRNAASEPHVQDLCHFLVALGAEIDGIGTNKLTVTGGRPLGAATYKIGPDHIEVGSFIGLAAVTGSQIRIADAGIEHLRSTLMGFARLGVSCIIDGPDLVVPKDQEMIIQSDLGGHVPKL